MTYVISKIWRNLKQRFISCFVFFPYFVRRFQRWSLKYTRPYCSASWHAHILLTKNLACYLLSLAPPVLYSHTLFYSPLFFFFFFSNHAVTGHSQPTGTNANTTRLLSFLQLGFHIDSALFFSRAPEKLNGFQKLPQSICPEVPEVP